ncbi:hypothetical protein A2W14_04445 [Candidatus Gottesmanbacteria bacterium RBG_16_37_8]|uniref:LytR/CpsA/Psr regulator C-terminal domain-containing protein n=1 Tax=Candidatus Gottesmanbacteria bacterium RBG_16_37_8 TaxID=1798371 RepID=A0A1F5YSA8_9BACT|nr:MAG: hypothetical protein A2W14_04445 [Candidatus Gottesmanbacteria bacterium RBG_16_37_8]
MRRKKPSKTYLFDYRRIVLFILLITFTYFCWSFRNSWNGKTRFTVVIENIDSNNSSSDYQMAIMSVEPNQNRGNYLTLRPNLLMDIPYGYKTYPVFSIYKLGELDKARTGAKLMKKAVETTLGIKTDRYLLFKLKDPVLIPKTIDEFKQFKRDNFSIIKGLPFIKTLISGDIATDMSLLEKLRFFLSFRNLRIDQISYLDPADSRVGISGTLPDKTQVYSLDLELFDSMTINDFQDIRVREEDFTLEVQNASGMDKIASQFSRILNHLGAHVIIVTTAAELNKNYCRIIYASQGSRDSVIAKILERDFFCREDNTLEIQAQTDIKVIIGEGFLK